jgi:hypothetical protein
VVEMVQYMERGICALTGADDMRGELSQAVGDLLQGGGRRVQEN